ncbi:MAG TPA: tetratricopeptide repeat protein [Thermoanaerobaculia bacterium]|nr:tetratricopeptide repeat protein [Thermoanaerobaculia bacterium]
MPSSEKELSDLGLVLSFLREGQGWKQVDLANAAGFSRKILNDYEKGRRTLTREKLEALIGWMGLPPERIDATRACMVANRAASRAPRDSADDRSQVQRQIEAVAARVGNLAVEFSRAALRLLTVEGEALHARQRAEFLWKQLEKLSPAERRLLVERGRKYRTWALMERVAAESVAQAPNHPKEALGLAELALLIAEKVPGEKLWRWRQAGYALLFVGNARRACSNLPGADEALAQGRKLFEAGAAGDPGFLNEVWLPWIESALRRAQRRFPEALNRIEEALALDRGELRGKILIAKANLHDALGDTEASTAALSEAAPLIDARREPRHAFGLRFNLAVDLINLERYEEAEARVPEVRALAEKLGEELDLTRTLWLQGKLHAGLGRREEARRAFAQVRRVFEKRDLAFDYALVSLELALLLLEQGRTAEVRALAEEMLLIFQTQKVEREPLAALQLFCDDAKLEAATVDLTRRVVKYLYCAQHDPVLRFVDEKGAEA